MSAVGFQKSDKRVGTADEPAVLPYAGPEHHVLVGASLLTAYKNAGGEVELETALIEMMSRGNLGVTMEAEEIRCSRSTNNNQCIQGRCPFFQGYLAGKFECYSAGKTHGKLGVGGSDRTERYRVSGHCGKIRKKVLELKEEIK